RKSLRDRALAHGTKSGRTPLPTRGVDSALKTEEALEDALKDAQSLAIELDLVVCMSGPTDWIVSRNRTARIENGHALMSRVTGMGCVSTALIAASAAVWPDPFEATVAGMVLTGVAGELAAADCQGPGSFQARFLDELYALDAKKLQLARVTLT
ncbi:MAG: hypothetical protein HC883_03890, partial [Bdellovibrionaceae bacterium]|nr:hypothetical protein [Pseudobdellovibrionaceae bacterium]